MDAKASMQEGFRGGVLGLGAYCPLSAIGGLSIFCRFAGQEHERAWTSDNDSAPRSAAHCLAVCAVANGRRFGIGFGLERHVAAVTTSVDFHVALLLRMN
jgi:hypothetical protein